MKDPFEGVDRVEYRTYLDPHRMSRSYRSFTRDLKRLFEKRGGQYYKETVKGNLYSIPILPKHGPKWFIVEFYPPPDDPEVEAKDPIELLFLFRDLYLLGFRVHGETVWRCFSDAQFFSEPNESGLTKEEIKAYIKDIRFGGNYGSIEQNYKKFCIGYFGQRESYNVLSKFRESSESQLKKALCRLVITLCEAVRFVEIMEMLIEVFEKGIYEKNLDVAVDHEVRYKNPSYHFNKWDVYCTTIRGGQAKFDTAKLLGFLGFESLLSFVGVMLPLNRLCQSFFFSFKIGYQFFFSSSKIAYQGDACVLYMTECTKVTQATSSHKNYTSLRSKL